MLFGEDIDTMKKNQFGEELKTMSLSLKSRESYIESIKTRPEQPIQIYSLSEFFEVVSVINSFFLQILYRGQSDISWEINSSAYRNLLTPTQEKLYKYHRSLIASSKYLHEENLDTLKKTSDLMFLTYLQHHGAKTNLIDFTDNPLVALWFACSDFAEKDAVVCWKAAGFEAINESKSLNDIFEDETRSIFKFVPPLFDRRVIAQSSVFLFPPNGKIESHLYRKIIISSGSKKEILDDLGLIGISQKTLFPDFSGFVEWFDYNGKDRLEALLEEGNLLESESRLVGGSENKLADALDIYLEAEKIGETVVGETDPRQAILYAKIGSVYDDLKKLDLAMEYHQKALQIREDTYGETNPETAKSYNSIAMQLRQRDEFDMAINYYKKAEAIRLKHFGENHPHTAELYNNIGFLYYQKDDLDNALDYYEKCRIIRESLSPDDTLPKATIYSNIAKVYIQKNNLEEARKMSDRALSIRTKLRGENHLTTSSAYFLSAQVELALHHYEKALELVEYSLKIRSDRRGAKSKLAGDCYNIIAKIAFSQEKYDAALTNYQKAQNIRENVFGTNNSDTAMIYEGLANTHLKLGNLSEAKRYSRLAGDVYARVFGVESQKANAINRLNDKIERENTSTTEGG